MGEPCFNPSSILIGLPLAYNYIAEPEQAIAYADKAMPLSPHTLGQYQFPYRQGHRLRHVAGL